MWSIYGQNERIKEKEKKKAINMQKTVPILSEAYVITFLCFIGGRCASFIVVS